MGRPPRKVSIAKALGVSGASVTRYLRRGMPCTSIEAALAWRAENIPPGLWRTGAASTGATPPAGEAAPATDAARLLRHRAAREEHEAALALMRRLEAEGRTLLMDDHKRIIFELSRRIRDALLQLPSRAAALVAAEREQAACQRILDAEVRAVLAQLARVGPPPANGGEGGPLQ